MFNWFQVSCVVVSTFLIFSWIFLNRKNWMWQDKAFYLIIVLFILIYCGIGCALVEVPANYPYYYFIYIFFLSISIYLFGGKSNKKGHQEKNILNEFIDRFGKYIILVYIFLFIIELCFPTFILFRIFNPPSADLNTLWAKIMNENNRYYNTVLSSVIYILKQFLFPFYLFSLYKYRYKILKLFICIFIVLYLDYCKNAYIARNIIGCYGIVFCYILYNFNPKTRKILHTVLIIVFPSVIVFFVNYTKIRIGAVVENISFEDAFNILLYKEGSLPVNFNVCVNNSSELWTDYLHWMITLPLPGFMKSIDADFAFNYILSEEILDTFRTSNNFYVILVGNVGESVFLFGKYFFWIHAIIYGFIISKVFYFLRKYNCFSAIFIYMAVHFGMVISRAGTVSGYPFVFKGIIILWLFVYIYQRFNSKLHIK
jgi:hypothetical protein